MDKEEKKLENTAKEQEKKEEKAENTDKAQEKKEEKAENTTKTQEEKKAEETQKKEEKKEEKKEKKSPGDVNRTIVFLYNGAGFLINAITTSLVNAGFIVSKAEASIKTLEDHQDEGQILMLFLGGFTYKNHDFMTAVKDCCYEKQKTLILIGEKKELESVEEYFPVSPRYIRFERPFNIKDFVTRIQELTVRYRRSKNRKKVLLVDDDGAFLKLVRGWLSNRYDVSVVNSGREALDFLKKKQPDLILLDYEMPGMSGPQVMERLRASTATATVPVIFLTGKDDRDSVMTALEHKPERYILKISDRDTLVAQVDSFFEPSNYTG